MRNLAGRAQRGIEEKKFLSRREPNDGRRTGVADWSGLDGGFMGGAEKAASPTELAGAGASLAFFLLIVVFRFENLCQKK